MGNAMGMENWKLALAITALGFFLAACSQETPVAVEQDDEVSAPQAEVPTEIAPDPPEQAPPSTEVAVERVEGLMVSQPSDQPETVVIFASGIVGSDGWTEPRLIPLNPDETSGTRSFGFVATSPDREMPSRVPQPIEARLELEMFPPEVEMVRIVSATNELTAFVGN